MHSAVLSSLLLAASVSAAPLEARAACAQPLILWARGAYEAPQASTLTPYISQLQSALGGATAIQINYPAVVFPSAPPFPPASGNIDSVNQGMTLTINNITSWYNQCGSQSRIILAGGSQGGQVITDTLVGGYGQEAPLPSMYRTYIKAAIVFGDPTYTLNGPATYTAGNATTNGAYQRLDSTQTDLNTHFGSILRSYCIQGDPVCSGLFTQAPNGIQLHGDEVAAWWPQAQKFVLSKFGK